MVEHKDSRLEDRRQLEHLVPVVFAFLLPYISFYVALAFCGLALLHALLISPRLVRVTTRPEEAGVGWSRGKVYYALSVAALLVFFQSREFLAAAVWAVLSVGDSLSNIVGRRFSTWRLPYNPRKTWAGLLTFWLSSSLAASILMAWNRSGDPWLSWFQIGLIAVITAGVCALAESLPAPIDDNLLIPWVGAFTILPVYLAVAGQQWPVPALEFWKAVAVNGAFGLPVILLGWVSLVGGVVAFVVGFLSSLGLGFGGFFTLAFFLLAGSVSTRLGRARKRARGVEEPRRGRRGVANVLANGSVPAAAAVMALWLPEGWVRGAFTCALATAAFDTVATEIGQWLGRTPINPRTFRPVPVGTPGAVSLEGTLAGVIAACLTAGVAWGGGLIGGGQVAWIGLAAAVAGFSESLWGAGLPDDRPETGHVLNFLNTLLGASLGGLLTCWIG